LKMLIADCVFVLCCSHMTCKKCKNEFCWVCMGPWSEHGTAFYACNRYDEKSGVDARDSQSQSRASLERYLHVRF
jgi:ariadne-1